MSTKTGTAFLTIGDKLRQFMRSRCGLLLSAGSVAGGLLMSRASLFGASAPFGAALCAALPWGYVPSAALGAVLGYIFSYTEADRMGDIAAVLLVVVARWLLSQGVIRLREQFVAVCSALFAMLLSSAIILLTTNFSIYNVFSSFAQIMLCSGSAYFFAQSIDCLGKGLDSATRAERSCVAISFSVLVTGLSPLAVGAVSLGRIIAVFVILLAARHSKEAGGAIAGVIAGITMGFSSGDFAYIISAYAFGGLVAGAFGNIGRLAVAAAFIVINALSAIFIGVSVDAYSAIAEIFVASLAFMLIPGSVQRYFQPTNINEISSELAARAALRRRMGDISATLLSISETTREVSRQMDRLKRGSPPDICANVAARVCTRCGRGQTCWNRDYSDTMNAFSDCVRTMRHGGSIFTGTGSQPNSTSPMA